MKRVVIACVSGVLFGFCAWAQAGLHQERSASDVDRSTLDRDFQAVPRMYRVMQYGMGHHNDLDKAERYGLGGLVCAARGDAYYKGDYLHDETEWSRLTNEVASAVKRGLKVWLFDERGYPSGGAGGLVVSQYPECENICVYQKKADGQGKRAARIDLPSDARRFVGAMVYPRDATGVHYDLGVPADVSAVSVSTKGMEGDWTLCAFIERTVFEGTHAEAVGPSFGWTGHYPNLLDRDAVAKYIGITYEAYARHLGPELMAQVEAIYSNEPSLQSLYFQPGTRPNGEAYVPWVASLPKTFRKMHGYDLLPHLGELYSGASNGYSRVRLHYYQTVGALMAESYAGQIFAWCRKHGTRLTGHILCEELMCYHPPLFGDFFKQIQQFDLPGSDMSILKADAPASGRLIGSRLVSSAARAVGKAHVQSLLDPVLGKWTDEQGKKTVPPLDALLRSVNLLFYNGVNFVTIYGSWDQYPAEEYERFNLYTGRLAVLLRDAVNAAQVAVYYPLESFQARYRPTPDTIWSEQNEYWDLQLSVWNIERLCHDNSIDHNFVNAEAVLKADVSGGTLALGPCRYKLLLMPAMGIVPLDVLKKIRRFEASGGKVAWTGALPALGAYAREDAKVAGLMSNVCAVSNRTEVLNAMRTAAPPDFTFEAGAEVRKAVLTSKYVRGGLELFLVINDGAAPAELKALRCCGASRFKQYDPLDGTIAVVDSGGSATLAPHRALVFTVDREQKK